MIQILQQKLSLYQCLTSSPSRAVGMEEIVRLIRYDNDVRYKTESYRKMASVLGKEKADEEVKRKMVPACSIGVLFDGNGRNAANILGFTGLALCDIDGLVNEELRMKNEESQDRRSEGGSQFATTIETVRQKINADPHTLLCYVTIGGNGFRIIYRYTRESAGDSLSTPLSPWRGAGGEAVWRGAGGEAVSFPAAFLKGNRYYAELVEHEYDAQCSDYSRLCGLAHDPEVYVNWEAEPFVITDEEILAANFSADKERGKPRREYAAGTHTVSVEDAWQNVEKTLAGRGLVYQSGHHHDYVMHAAFLMNRYGVDLDELLQWASQVWSDYNNKERENTIRSCYKKTQEHGTWRLNRKGRKPKETSMITLPEIKDWLRQHVEVIYNVVTDQLMYKSLTPYPSPRGEGSDYTQWLRDGKELTTPLSPWRGAGGEAFGLLDERVVCSIRSQMAADTGKRVLKNDVMDVLRSDFARLYHPVREYIESLPAWDGKDRVKELCSHVIESEELRMKNQRSLVEGKSNEEFPTGKVGGKEEIQSSMGKGTAVADSSLFILHSSLFEWALHKWLVACVASWMSDLSSNHEIFVLIGAQGIYKTTFFRHLLPPQLRMYFWENAHNSFSSKDDHLALAENCLVEIEEIDLQNPRDISELKALATSENVKDRRPYARFREEKHRLASFCGSGNQQHFLSDDTGNRRWLCFKVDHIDDPRTWGIDYDQLYAQLRDELRQGFRYWFDPDEQRIVEQQNQAFRIESDEEQLIRSRLRPPRATDKITLMNAASICQFINGGVVGRGLSTRRVGIVMGKMGFKKIHTMRGWFYEVYQIPPNEIQPTLAMADDTEEDSNNSAPTFEEANLPF